MHREIAVATKMLAELRQKMADKKITGEEPSLRDAFGRRQSYQLGVPHGDNGHTLFDVSPQLALHIMEAHIVTKQRELVEACAVASMELSGTLPLKSAETPA